MIEMAKDDLQVIPVYFKYRLWETADYDDFELEDEMQRAFGESTRVVGNDDEGFRHGLHTVDEELKDEPRGGEPSEEDASTHRQRYLNLLRLGLYGEDRMKAMAEEDAKRVEQAGAERS